MVCRRLAVFTKGCTAIRTSQPLSGCISFKRPPPPTALTNRGFGSAESIGRQRPLTLLGSKSSALDDGTNCGTLDSLAEEKKVKVRKKVEDTKNVFT